jgi:hypothetical protein
MTDGAVTEALGESLSPSQVSTYMISLQIFLTLNTYSLLVGRLMAKAFGMTADSKMVLLYDFDSKKWSVQFHDTGTIGFPMWSPDGRYVYFDSVLSEHPGYRRVKLGQTMSEFMLDFRDLRRYERSIVSPWSAVAPDGSSLEVRDVSTDEIYALGLELP